MGHTSPSCVSFCSLNDQTYEAQVCWSWLLFEFAEATRLMSSIGFSTNSFQNRGCYGAHVPNMLFLLFSELSQQATASATTRATGEANRQGWHARAVGEGNGRIIMGPRTVFKATLWWFLTTQVHIILQNLTQFELIVTEKKRWKLQPFFLDLTLKLFYTCSQKLVLIIFLRQFSKGY